MVGGGVSVTVLRVYSLQTTLSWYSNLNTSGLCLHLGPSEERKSSAALLGPFKNGLLGCF